MPAGSAVAFPWPRWSGMTNLMMRMRPSSPQRFEYFNSYEEQPANGSHRPGPACVFLQKNLFRLTLRQMVIKPICHYLNLIGNGQPGMPSTFLHNQFSGTACSLEGFDHFLRLL